MPGPLLTSGRRSEVDPGWHRAGLQTNLEPRHATRPRARSARRTRTPPETGWDAPFGAGTVDPCSQALILTAHGGVVKPDLRAAVPPTSAASLPRPRPRPDRRGGPGPRTL